MAIRISVSAEEQSILQIDGWLDEEAADELQRVARKQSMPLVLDLNGIRSVDPHGVRVLLALADEGAELRGLSNYLELLLESGRQARDGLPSDQRS